MAKKQPSWFYKKNGALHGPFRLRDIKRLVLEGVIDADDLLLKKGLPGPIHAKVIPHLFRTQSTPATRRRLVNVLLLTGFMILLAIVLSPISDLVNSMDEGQRRAAFFGSILFATSSLATLLIGLGTLGSTYKTVRVGAATPLDEDQKRALDSLWRLVRPPERSVENVAVTPNKQECPTPPQSLARFSVFDRRSLIQVAVVAAGMTAAALVFLRQGSDKFPYPVARVSGVLKYRDGDLLLADELQLTFYPQVSPLDQRTFPRAGSAIVNGKTGRFASATTFRPGDGLIRGKHKVTVHLPGRRPLPAAIAGEEYSDSARTPLEIETSSQPLAIVLEKPDRTSATRTP